MPLPDVPRIEWTLPEVTLSAAVPSARQIKAQAPLLVEFFNDPHNRHMMGHTVNLTVPDLIDHYARLGSHGGFPFFLFANEVLVGDADFRRIKEGSAEFAIAIGARKYQGRGYGTRFAIMLHDWAFEMMDLKRIYVTIIPQNAASLRLFEKLGYLPDGSEKARSYADDPSDHSLSIDRAAFEKANAPLLATATYQRTGP